MEWGLWVEDSWVKFVGLMGIFYEYCEIKIVREYSLVFFAPKKRCKKFNHRCADLLLI